MKAGIRANATVICPQNAPRQGAALFSGLAQDGRVAKGRRQTLIDQSLAGLDRFRLRNRPDRTILLVSAIYGALAKVISYHRAKLAECLKPNMLCKSVDRCLRNPAIARNHSSTFESNHFRPVYDLPRNLF
ncbi:hypothetical protein GGD57_004174 [Rhizobium esperanzae]|uniref:Transposase DDE domain-containing protein n=1 Tax=Rhizobium esperanzae TaxID=1967781 RepID=A0A7W6R6G4_9HYPH|nr:hypothetical protein [Rhizobium esperanzae]